jgi:hypothetical protein
LLSGGENSQFNNCAVRHKVNPILQVGSLASANDRCGERIPHIEATITRNDAKPQN